MQGASKRALARRAVSTDAAPRHRGERSGRRHLGALYIGRATLFGSKERDPRVEIRDPMEADPRLLLAELMGSIEMIVKNGPWRELSYTRLHHVAYRISLCSAKWRPEAIGQLNGVLEGAVRNWARHELPVSVREATQSKSPECPLDAMRKRLSAALGVCSPLRTSQAEPALVSLSALMHVLRSAVTAQEYLVRALAASMLRPLSRGLVGRRYGAEANVPIDGCLLAAVGGLLEPVEWRTVRQCCRPFCSAPTHTNAMQGVPSASSARQGTSTNPRCKS